MICEHCENKITEEDKYIKHEYERYCSECYESHTITIYSIGGEYLATDDDGVVEYDSWSKEDIE